MLEADNYYLLPLVLKNKKYKICRMITNPLKAFLTVFLGLCLGRILVWIEKVNENHTL